MLIDAIGADQVYPNDDDLARLPRRFYPGPLEFVEILRSGQTHGARIFIGHFPFTLHCEFEKKPITVALLREPTARTLSMLKHRKMKSPRFSDVPYEEILEHTNVVDRQLRDYQTKIFAFNSIRQCPDTVNIAFEINEPRFTRALDRLSRVDVLGLTEDFQEFCRRFTEVTEIELRPRRDNASVVSDPLLPHESERIESITVHDQLLYQEAKALIY